jgi:hypothetical protein
MFVIRVALTLGCALGGALVGATIGYSIEPTGRDYGRRMEQLENKKNGRNIGAFGGLLVGAMLFL